MTWPGGIPVAVSPGGTAKFLRADGQWSGSFTGSPVFTQGSVIFAGVGGVLTEDNANLFWDDTNNRLGIGVTPLNDLHVRKAVSGAVSSVVANTSSNSAAYAATYVGNDDGNYIELLCGSSTFTDGVKTSGAGSVAATKNLVFVAGNLGAASTNILFVVGGTNTSFEKARITAAGSFGIGTTTPAGTLDVAQGGTTLTAVFGADNGAGSTRTNSTAKVCRLANYHYTNAEEPFGLIVGNSGAAANSVVIGGGSSLVNAATSIAFNTAANTTTTGGTERASIDTNGNIICGSAAIATNATNGFLYVPTCAGTPTGTPTTVTGRVPIVADSTNNKLYIYSSGAWVALN